MDGPNDSPPRAPKLRQHRAVGRGLIRRITKEDSQWHNLHGRHLFLRALQQRWPEFWTSLRIDLLPYYGHNDDPANLREWRSRAEAWRNSHGARDFWFWDACVATLGVWSKATEEQLES